LGGEKGGEESYAAQMHFYIMDPMLGGGTQLVN
jgi:hypothetical protein